MRSNRARTVVGRAAPPALLALVFAATQRTGPAIALAVTALVVVHAGIVVPQAVQVIERWIGTVARAVGLAFAGVALITVELVVVLPVWLVQRVVRFDSLDDPRGRGRWRPPPVDGWEDPARWTRRSFSGQLGPSLRRRGHAWLVVAMPVLLAGLPFAVRSGIGAWDSRTAREATQRDFEAIGEPFGPELFREFGHQNTGLRYDPVTGYRSAEQDERYTHVHDRVRRSYQPAGRPQATVWFFGGSTMFGVGQRDDHTLPSEVARAAEAEGIDLRVVNYGTLGYVNWQEVQLFQLLLAQGKRPDLAVFYDGCNEMALGIDRVTQGEPHPGDPRDLDSNLIEHDLGPRSPNSPRADPKQTVPAAQRLAAATRRGADQYRQGVSLARRLGRSFGVPTTFVWQPTLATRPPRPSDRLVLARLGYKPWLGWDRADVRRLEQGILDRSRVDAIDLHAALDHGPSVTYFDECHTTEAAARLVASAMYHRLRPAILAAAHRRGG